jgi:hypothetical protein
LGVPPVGVEEPLWRSLDSSSGVLAALASAAPLVTA